MRCVRTHDLHGTIAFKHKCRFSTLIHKQAKDVDAILSN